MRIMSTVDIPTNGTVTYKGEDIIKTPKLLRRELGYLPQDFGVYPNMTASEFLEYMAAMKSIAARTARKRISELVEILNLTDARKRQLGGFSGGMKQRVGIAQALLNDPKVLIVDEPTVGLDPEERINFRNLLASLADNRIIILSTHIVSDIESIAPTVALMVNGQIIAHDHPEALIAEAEGKVWGCVVSTAELAVLQKSAHISNAIQRSDGIHVRIVSDHKPVLNASPVLPSLEDACASTALMIS